MCRLFGGGWCHYSLDNTIKQALQNSPIELGTINNLEMILKHTQRYMQVTFKYCTALYKRFWYIQMGPGTNSRGY